VNAASFKAAIERNANPKMASPSVAFMHDIVGADARNDGKAGSVSGVTAKGNTLTIRLTKNNPTLLSILAMPFFTAIKPNMAIDPRGLNAFPSAGPYKIASRNVGSQLVLERNPFYKGTRPANPDRMVINTNTDLNQSLLQVRAGQIDLDLSGLPPTAHDELSRLYGVKRGGSGRYFVNSYNGTTYLALNTARSAFAKTNVRKAVNYGIDRPALVRVAGKFSGKRTDQILPPGIAGFRDAKLYPIKGADPAKAKQLLNGYKGDITILHTTSATSVARAQVLQYNLTQMGLGVKLKPQPFGVAIKTAGTRGADFDAFLIGWVADYPDPFDFINVLLDGDNIQESNNSNYSYFRSPKYTKLMNDASKLTGDARSNAYGKLDVDIMKNAAPWASFANSNSRELVSARITNYVYSPVYAGAILSALAIK
jgi:ABC-type transport system substrate-binding protein